MKHILISTGHGLRSDGVMDNGAYDKNTKTTEFSLNSLISGFCIRALEAQKVFRVTSDTGILAKDVNPDWRGLKRWLAANRPTPDLVLEVHHDMPTASPAGFGIMPRISSYPSKKLCQNISDAYIKRHLPVKPSYVDVRGLGLLRGLTMPVLIWESGNTTAYDISVLQLKGLALAEGVTKYFGHSWIEPNLMNISLATKHQTITHLKRGDAGPLVGKLQEILGVDNQGHTVFGPMTEMAVRNWQDKNDYNVTGLVTEQQMKLLGLI